MKWILAFLCLLIAPAVTRASDLASPCPPAPASIYPAFDASPAIGVWHQKELMREGWTPPPCTGWPSATNTRQLVTLAGRFRFAGSMNDLLDRIGAISSLEEVRYWSDNDKEWSRLATNASALTSSSAASRRSDFKAADLSKGAQLFYWENDESNRETVYRLNVYASSSDYFVLANENVTPIKRFVFTIFKPATLQSVMIVQRLSENSFGVYMLSRTDTRASALSEGHESVFVNRSIALYRKLVGAKTGLEPPSGEWNGRSHSSPTTLLALSSTAKAP
jgi:hypothetical protein